jgi:hypothetical protein
VQHRLSLNRYLYHRNRAWAAADPRLLWRPIDEIRSILRCISRRRLLPWIEARRIARKIARERCSRIGEHNVIRAIFDGLWYPSDFMWRGRIIRVWKVHWESLEREARAEKLQFCLIDKHRDEIFVRLMRRERELDEIRYLTNKLVRTIADERRKQRETDPECPGDVRARSEKRSLGDAARPHRQNG